MRSEAVTLATSRLLLRPWRASDYAPYAAMCRDPEVMEFMPPKPDRAASDALIDRMRSFMDEEGWGFWAVQEKNSGSFAGTVGLHAVRDDLLLPPGVEAGWRLARSFWGKGYATEAATAALCFGFAFLGLSEIIAYAALKNERSQAVMRRLGMQRRNIIFEHPLLDPTHPHRAHCVYGIDKHTWQSRSPNDHTPLQDDRQNGQSCSKNKGNTE